MLRPASTLPRPARPEVAPGPPPLRPAPGGPTRHRLAALRLAPLDGLRAVAALAVVAYHVCLLGGATRAGPMAPVLAGLKGGVTLFFVLSGCLLYLPYARAIRDGQPLPLWRPYARRRVTRIIPGYWVALTILGLMPLAGGVFTADWWRYYGLTQIYDPGTVLGGLGVAWSLCVEVSFYVALPFAARAMALLVGGAAPAGRFVRQLGALGLVGAAALGLRFLLAGSMLATVRPGGVVAATALPGALDWFAVGMALAVLASEWQLDPHRGRGLVALARRPALCRLLAAGCYLAGSALAGGDVFLPLVGVITHLLLGLTSALLILPALHPDRPVGGLRLLGGPAMGWAGTVSYGVYLWQVPLLQALAGTRGASGHALGPVALLALLVGGTSVALAAGAASWYLVERPAQRLAARSSRSPSPAPPPGLSPPAQA